VTLVVFVFVGGVLAVIAPEVARPLREARRLREALRQANLGPHDKARQALEPLVDARQHLIAAQAATRLAELEYQRGEVGAALSQAEHALARLTAWAEQFGMSEALAPLRWGASRQRATALAALRRDDEASAEIALLGEQAGTAKARVAVLTAIHDRRYLEAERLATALADIGGLNDAMLRDLLRAAIDRIDRVDRERLEMELQRPDVSAWARAVVPELSI
jgi:hypothetical protein